MSKRAKKPGPTAADVEFPVILSVYEAGKHAEPGATYLCTSLDDLLFQVRHESVNIRDEDRALGGKRYEMSVQSGNRPMGSLCGLYTETPPRIGCNFITRRWLTVGMDPARVESAVVQAWHDLARRVEIETRWWPSVAAARDGANLAAQLVGWIKWNLAHDGTTGERPQVFHDACKVLDFLSRAADEAEEARAKQVASR